MAPPPNSIYDYFVRRRRAAATRWRERGDATGWVRDRAQIGDLILIGSRDRVSRVIQRASNSRFSHAGVLTDANEVTEAYDYSLTLNEQDEGIYRTSLAAFLARTPNMHVVSLLRPAGLDVDRLQQAAKDLYRAAPPYPTVGAFCLGFIRTLSEPIPLLEEGLFGQHRVGKRLHRRLDQFARAQVRFVGDGIHKVHCAESVVQIYEAAGLTLQLQQVFLRRAVDRARDERLRAVAREFDVPVNPSTDRTGRSRTARHVVRQIARHPIRSTGGLYRVWKVRMDTRHLANPEDFIFPGDLEMADGLSLIGERRVGKEKRRDRKRASSARKRAQQCKETM